MIAIIDYTAGNTRSVINALARLNCESVVTSDTDLIQQADKVILPGVGNAAAAMQDLKRKKLDILLPQLKQPVLGICLGQQLLCSFSEEGNTAGLGIFKTRVRQFAGRERVPHMGWNTITDRKGPLFKNIFAEDHFYFVHSFYCELCTDTVAVTDYQLPFSAALQRNNFFGTQFHPEKSGDAGETILLNFLDL